MSYADDMLFWQLQRSLAAEAAHLRAEHRAADARTKVESRAAIERSRVLLSRDMLPSYLTPATKDRA